MKRVQTAFLEAIFEERNRITSRRGLISGGAKLAAGGVLAAAAIRTPSFGLFGVSAQEFESDVDVLNYALTLEHLEHVFYRDGLEAFESFGEDGFGESIQERLAAIRDHEEAHVDTLTQVITDLGGEPVGEGEYDFGYGEDQAAFLATAAALENTGVSAYDGAGQFLSDPALLTAAGTIVAVEARHASYLNLLTGTLPFPAAVETPLTPAEVLEIATPFIVQ